MDKMDRMLHELPVPVAAPDLVGRVRLSIRRRHRRRQTVRGIAASVLTLSGLWLAFPAVPSIPFGDLFAPGAPWLFTSLDTLSLETYKILDQLWNGMFSLQSAMGSSLVVSLWIGILLLCFGMFFAVDMQAIQAPFHSHQKQLR
jgi:hypothetical protein